jgi:hypothetical protein
MKHILIAVLALVLSSSVWAQRERKHSNQETDKQSKEIVARLEARLASINKVLDQIDWQPENYIDKQLAKQQKTAEVTWRKWMLEVRNELKDYSKDLGQYLKSLGNVMQSAGALTRAESEFNLLFTNMQRKFLDESKQFDQLTAASKARHDIAMNAIRNMK